MDDGYCPRTTMNITIADFLSRQALIRPEKEAIAYRDRSLTFEHLNREVDRVAAVLLDSGLKKGDRVAVFMEKSVEEAVSLLAAARCGGVFVDINHLLKAPQVEHVLHDSGSRFLFTTRQRMMTIAPVVGRCDELKTVILHGQGEVPQTDGREVLDRDAVPVDLAGKTVERIVETDIGAIIYTSGSTGMPKGVVLSHRNLVAGAESVAGYLENRPEDRILSVLPFSFDYGLNQLTTSLLSGATCVLMNYLFPNDILGAMEKHAATGLALIPPLWLQILQKEWDHKRFPQWRYLTNTGGRLPETTIRELRRRLPQTKIYPMFGLTEAFRATYLPPEEVDRRPTSIGKAIPNAEIWVLNEKGEHCRPGEEGELVQRGAHVALGYWNDPERTAERFKPNPFAPAELQMDEMVVFSGDRVKTDEDGFIYFIGRKDELIKTSGYRVSPTEVEEALYATGHVKHAAAFGIPDDIMGQVVVAVVSLRDGSSPEGSDLVASCAGALPTYMMPKRVDIWEELPLNPNGKIDRGEVRRRFFVEHNLESDHLAAAKNR